jgi:hypothetical protein
MLLFESQNLVVSLFAETLSVVGQVIELLDLFNRVVNLTNVALVDSSLVAELLSPNVDLASKDFILSLEVIVLGQSCLQLIFKKLNFVLVLSHLGSGRSNRFEDLLFVSKLLSEFLLLIAKNHHVSKFKRRTVTAVR